MRILQVVQNHPWGSAGGCEIYTASLCEELERRGHEIHVFCPASGGAGTQGAAEIHATDAKPAEQFKNPALRFVRTFRHPVAEDHFRNCMRAVDPDVVHFQHVRNLSGNLLAIAASQTRAVVVTLHDYWFLCQGTTLRRPDGALCAGPEEGARCAFCWQSRRKTTSARLAATLAVPMFLYRTAFHSRALRSADKVIVPSRFMTELWRKAGLPDSKVVFVPYGINRTGTGNLGHRPRERASLPRNIGYYGALRPHKGVHILLQAFRQLTDSKARLSIWGNGAADSQYVNHLRTLAAEGAVTFQSEFAHDRLNSILGQLDLLVVPSLWPETGPLVVLEALDYGLPVLGSRIGGIAERIEEHGGGLLFEPGNVDDLRQCLQRFIAGTAAIPERKKPVPDIGGNAGDVETVYGDAISLASVDARLRRNVIEAPRPGGKLPEHGLSITVAVPCWNGRDYIKTCMNAISDQTRKPDEVLFVDDGSTDGSPDVAALFPVRVLLSDRRRGLGAARNRALKEAQGDIVVYVDVDTRAMPDLLEVLLRSYSCAAVGGVGGRGVELDQNGLANRWRRHFWVQTQGTSRIYDTWMLSGICSSYRRTALLDVGGMDEFFRTNGEDVDIGLRLRTKGWRLVYDPNAIVIHHRRDSVRSLSRLTARHTFWQCRALRRNGQSSWPVMKNTARWVLVSAVSSLIRHKSVPMALASLVFCGCAVSGGVAALVSGASRPTAQHVGIP